MERGLGLDSSEDRDMWQTLVNAVMDILVS
jgi:hypothetical protein